MNCIEIERRFLLKNDNWRKLASTPEHIIQGYLSVEKQSTVRVRLTQTQAWLTLKGHISDISRHEFEYAIPTVEAQLILKNMCSFVLEKNRYHIKYQGFDFEIDEFFGINAPLIIAELEVPNEQTPFIRPNWLGAEITADARFTNAYLSKHPYSSWASCD